MERVYTAVPAGGPIAGNLMRLNAKSVLLYSLVWLPLLACKFLFDVTVIAQTARTAKEIESRSFVLAWGYTSVGKDNAWISIGLWVMTTLMCVFDTYIAFS